MKKGQAPIVFGMLCCAASLILRRFDLDFLSGVCLGVSLGLFFLGFRALYRK
jgi:multisubunit Na+/H+ antiporter MnhB subunit